MPKLSRNTIYADDKAFTFLVSETCVGCYSAVRQLPATHFTSMGIIRYHVLFVIRLKTREVQIAGITAQPRETWMKQMARNLTDTFDGFLCGVKYLIIDRDPLYTGCFRHMLKDSGTNPVRLPARSPDLNAFAERFVLSIKSECLNKFIPLGEKHLRLAIKAYVEHYHAERNHQGLTSRIIHADETVGRTEGVLKTRSRFSGFLNYYSPEAA